MIISSSLGCDGFRILFSSPSPCMAGTHPTPRSFLPFPLDLFSTWTSELLAASISFVFSLFFVFIFLPLAMLYHSRSRFGIDELFLVKLELPPAKRRKGLAGSIVSTALSAALIGTAVGLTMYRL